MSHAPLVILPSVVTALVTMGINNLYSSTPEDFSKSSPVTLEMLRGLRVAVEQSAEAAPSWLQGQVDMKDLLQFV